MEEMGLKSHLWMCWSKVCCSQLKSLLNLLFTALCWHCYYHSSGAYCWSSCLQLRVYGGVWLLTAQLTKVDFIYCVMDYFPKSGLLERWVLSTCYPVESVGLGEPLPRKLTPNFTLRGPQHVLSGRRTLANVGFLTFYSNFRATT